MKQANMHVTGSKTDLFRVTQNTSDACITEGLPLQQKNVHRVAILVYSTAVFASSPSE
jgi:hypothetical protein